MKIEKLKTNINNLWEKRKKINNSFSKKEQNIIIDAIDLLDCGKIRVSNKVQKKWIVNQWVKKAVLLFFQVTDQKLIKNGPGNSNWWDKEKLFKVRFQNSPKCCGQTRLFY